MKIDTILWRRPASQQLGCCCGCSVIPAPVVSEHQSLNCCFCCGRKSKFLMWFCFLSSVSWLVGVIPKEKGKKERNASTCKKQQPETQKQAFQINCEHMTTPIEWIVGEQLSWVFLRSDFEEFCRDQPPTGWKSKTNNSNNTASKWSSAITLNPQHLFKLVSYFLKQTTWAVYEKKEQWEFSGKGYLRAWSTRVSRRRGVFPCASPPPNCLNSPLAIHQVHIQRQAASHISPWTKAN